MLRAAAMALVLVLLAGCGVSRGAIDYTLAEGIVWPGAPEKPRVLYLWSLSRIGGTSGRERLVSALAGGAERYAEEPWSAPFLVRPHGVFVRDGRMYVADTGGLRVVVVDLKTMETFTITGFGEIRFGGPVGVVADGVGNIYVTDPNLRATVKFDRDGKFLGLFEGNPERPTGIAINRDGSGLFVVDTWAHIIYKYDVTGAIRGTIGRRGGAPGEFNYPTHIAVDRDGNLYVSDTLNFRIQMLTPRGAPLASFGLIGDSFLDFDKIKGIAVDAEGHIYIVDSAQDMVKVYDRNGRLLMFFGEKGHSYGDFYLPTGIYIDESDRIYVSDAVNRRVEAFQFLGGD
jgi:sugar lactone lactonase YvrE